MPTRKKEAARYLLPNEVKVFAYSLLEKTISFPLNPQISSPSSLTLSGVVTSLSPIILNPADLRELITAVLISLISPWMFLTVNMYIPCSTSHSSANEIEVMSRMSSRVSILFIFILFVLI